MSLYRVCIPLGAAGEFWNVLGLPTHLENGKANPRRMAKRTHGARLVQPISTWKESGGPGGTFEVSLIFPAELEGGNPRR